MIHFLYILNYPSTIAFWVRYRLNIFLSLFFFSITSAEAGPVDQFSELSQEITVMREKRLVHQIQRILIKVYCFNCFPLVQLNPTWSFNLQNLMGNTANPMYKLADVDLKAIYSKFLRILHCPLQNCFLNLALVFPSSICPSV